MRLSTDKLTGIGTTGATGIALMVLHATGYIIGWAWPILYILLIIAGMGQETEGKKKNAATRND